MSREYNGVLVFSEDARTASELLSKGREIADLLQTELSTILMGHNVNTDSFMIFGADKIYVVDDPKLQLFNAEIYTATITEMVKLQRPEIILIGGTKRGKELAAKVATRLETGCVTDCINLDVDKEERLVHMTRVVYSGKALAVEVCRRNPQMATVPPRLFERKEYKDWKSEIIKAEAVIGQQRTEIVEVRQKEISATRIEDADIIVSGGRGVKSKEDFKILKELARVLGGQEGNSRPVATDRKWFPDWVGLSGHKVRPRLYLACGISGAVQHIAGIRDSHIIAAINLDPEAPIFSAADYGIVGDLYEVVPALTEAVKRYLDTMSKH